MWHWVAYPANWFSTKEAQRNRCACKISYGFDEITPFLEPSEATKGPAQRIPIPWNSQNLEISSERPGRQALKPAFGCRTRWEVSHALAPEKAEKPKEMVSREPNGPMAPTGGKKGKVGQ